MSCDELNSHSNLPGLSSSCVLNTEVREDDDSYGQFHCEPRLNEDDHGPEVQPLRGCLNLVYTNSFIQTGINMGHTLYENMTSITVKRQCYIKNSLIEFFVVHEIIKTVKFVSQLSMAAAVPFQLLCMCMWLSHS